MAMLSDERKSLRRTYRGEDGKQVLAVNLAYDSRETVLQIERIDQAYCKAHPEDVQAAVSVFLVEANEELTRAGYAVVMK